MDIEVTVVLEKTFIAEDKEVRELLDLSEDTELTTLSEDQIEALEEAYGGQFYDIPENQDPKIHIRQLN